MPIIKLLVVAAVLAMVQRMLFSWLGLRKIRYERKFSVARAFAGDKIWMEERLVNAKWLPLPWLRAETQMPAALRFGKEASDLAVSVGQTLQNHASLFTLGPYTKLVRRHEVTCLQRGRYRIQTLTITHGDLLGMTSGALQVESDCAVAVYPRLLGARELPRAAREWMQSALSSPDAFREDHYHTAGVRAYRGGDAMKQVNWNATAKSGELLVNRRETMVGGDVTVLLNAELADASTNRRLPSEQFEEAVSIAASVAKQTLDGGGRAGLIFNGRVRGDESVPLRIEPARGRSQLYAILEATTGFEPVVRLELGYLLGQLIQERMRGANLMLVTAFLTPKQEQAVRQLRQAGNRVEVMLLYKERQTSSQAAGGTP
ncbi:DUF58 domain-containing protein [Cohnella hashimotonis]|uniref:DUF58 domain-containing protein n=1 Tax=Cohnella hashimotonis TaxID=2826895 RepID=A0ABT6TRD5_9BACL|nr:DUF58 domain-containing protein [Cohnella hashimotonis]MDI4648880.1 DUF58 domain-containing protein [Cohnella hashimotonis]